MPQTANLDRLNQEVLVLANTAKLLTSLDIDEVLSETLALLIETLGAERGSFFLISQNGKSAERFIIKRDLPPERSQTVVDQVLSEGLAGWVYRHKQSALIADAEKDERWVYLPDDPSATRSVLCVPFIYDAVILGIMTLEHHNPDQFNASDVRLATTIANQAAIALRNAHLFDQVETQERQINAVLQSTLEPILTITPDGVVRLANQTALEMIGQPESRVVGQPLSRLTSNPLLPEVAARLEDGHTRIELRDDDNHRDYVVQISSWRSGDGTELGRVIVFNDITLLKDLSRLKTQMLQMTSHDLKNPLGIIMGYAEMMLMELEPDDMHFEYVADIARVAQRMQDMITQLLNLERIEQAAQGEGTLFNPLPLIEDILNDLRRQFEQKQQTLTYTPPVECPDLHGDPAQIREAFKNLIENASKYTPEGGTAIIHVGLDHEQRRFMFAVEDNGYGIPDGLQPRIFERFYRAKQPGAERITGTGLGLSLVKAVVERHGGHVWFKSAAGEGSTFGLWLPVPDETPSETAHPTG